MNEDRPAERVASDDSPTRTVLRPGVKMFGRYTLETMVGRGGMGVVWRAKDEELNESVALKFLPDEVARDFAAVDELKEETRKARQLTHKNIVRIHQFERDPSVAAVSMEYVDGETLSQMRIAQPGKVFSVDALAPIVGQLAVLPIMNLDSFYLQPAHRLHVPQKYGTCRP